MPDVKIRWIKITTDMFSNAKIKLIRKMPEGDAILNTWIHLICLAGACNDRGNVTLSDTIPYTDEMLATILERDILIVRLALATLQRLHMINWEDGDHLFIPNFAKHQNINGLERVRALNAARNRLLRERRKLLPEGHDVSVTSRDGVDKEEEEEREGEEERDIILPLNPFRVWQSVLESLRPDVSQSNYKTWLSNSVGMEITDSKVVIGVPNEFHAAYLENNMAGLIEKAIVGVTGLPLKPRFVLIEEGVG